MAKLDAFLNSVEYDLSQSEESSVLLEHYTLESLLYRSEYSQIFKAQQSATAEWYTLKAISKKSRLTLDGNNLKTIDHSRISKVVAFIETQNYYYVVKPYVSGCSLSHYIKTNGPLSSDLTKCYFEQIVDVLKYLHHPSRNIVYRDLKPENLVITPEGEIYVIDIETTRIIKPNCDADTVNIASRGYTAPEQYGFAQTDRRSDIYSLGATLYYLLTGEVPKRQGFDSDDFGAFNLDDLGEPWSRVIRRCLAFNPKDRYQSVEELMEAVELKSKGVIIKPTKTQLSILAMVLLVSIGILGLIRSVDVLRPLDVKITPAQVQTTHLVASEDELLVDEGQSGEDLLTGSMDKLDVTSQLTLEAALKYYQTLSKDSMSTKRDVYTFSYVLNDLPLSDGIYPFYIRTVSDFGDYNQTGADRVEVRNGKARFDSQFTQSDLYLVPGYEYTHIIYVDQLENNRHLDWNEPYAQIRQSYSGGYTHQLTIEEWNLYQGEIVNSFTMLWDPGSRPEDYYYLTVSFENAPFDGVYDMYFSVSNGKGQMNQAGGRVAIKNGRAFFPLRMPKSAIYLQENEPYDLILYIDHLSQDANLSEGEAYAKKMEIYLDKPLWRIHFDYWHTY
jgi:hypothetical protein